MSTAQLQLVITKKVLATEDENFLKQVLDFLQKKPVKAKNKTYVREATPEEASLIQEGLDSGFLSVEETQDVLSKAGYKSK